MKPASRQRIGRDAALRPRIALAGAAGELTVWTLAALSWLVAVPVAFSALFVVLRNVSPARPLLPLMARDLWFMDPTGTIGGTRSGRLRDEVPDRLVRWNGDMDRYSPEPPVFRAGARALQRRIPQDQFPAAREVWARPIPGFLFAVHSDRGESAIWCDIRPFARVETCRDQVPAALDEALAWLAGRYGDAPPAWSWGEEHKSIIEWPPIGSNGPASDLLSSEAPTSGDPCTQFSTMSVSDDDPSFVSGWMQGEYLPISMDLPLARGGAVGASRPSPLYADTTKRIQHRSQ